MVFFNSNCEELNIVQSHCHPYWHADLRTPPSADYYDIISPVLESSGIADWCVLRKFVKPRSRLYVRVSICNRLQYWQHRVCYKENENTEIVIVSNTKISVHKSLVLCT